MNLKNILKSLKLNETSISMVLGIGVIILVGILAVNYFKKPNVGSTVPGTNTQESAKPEVGEKYIIKEGDNLWKIAEEAYGSGYNWIDIAKENNIANSDEITKGQELSLPVVEAKTITKSSLGSVITDNETTNQITGDKYEVVKGDNLWNIAVRAYGDGYKWTEIAQANELVHPNLIHPGNILTLPR